jgi:hypothetical protein
MVNVQHFCIKLRFVGERSVKSTIGAAWAAMAVCLASPASALTVYSGETYSAAFDFSATTGDATSAAVGAAMTGDGLGQGEKFKVLLLDLTGHVVYSKITRGSDAKAGGGSFSHSEVLGAGLASPAGTLVIKALGQGGSFNLAGLALRLTDAEGHARQNLIRKLTPGAPSPVPLPAGLPLLAAGLAALAALSKRRAS